jgi:hypothetical protein
VYNENLIRRTNQMSSSYKELNNLVRQGGKYLNKQLTKKELQQLDNINYVAKITREDLLQKAIKKQLAKKQAVEDYENNNMMKKLSRGE